MRPLTINAFLFALITLNATPLTNAQTKFESVYTDLAATRCRTIETDKETGSSVQTCPGVSGYKLLVLDDDSRQSITVVDPSGKKHPLEFWEVVTTGFSSVGNKAEWRGSRVKGKLKPMALIVRVNASENSENPQQLTSYLAVSKVTAEQICVTHKVPPGSTANDDARRAADSAQSAPCLKAGTP